MLTYEAAKEIALSYVQKINESQVDYHPAYLAYLQRDDPTYKQKKINVILTDSRKESFGWIFFYDSKEYVEMGKLDYALGGNAPIIVNKTTGELTETGTARSIEYYIDLYKAKLGLE